MASCAMGTAIDVAAWLLERARSEDMYLQPQKLQRLLYCAQACYAHEYQGRRLMPAAFVVHELGPVEPNIFRLFEAGRPNVVIDMPPPEIETFLERVWRRFARNSVERLTTLVTASPAYREIAARGDGEIIPFAIVAESVARRDAPAEKSRTPDGRTIQKWTPRRAAPREPR